MDPERLRTLLVLRRPAGYGFEIFTVRRFYCQTGTMVDCLQDRALLLSLTELCGPRLESGFLREVRLAWYARALLGTPLSTCPTTCALVWWGNVCYIEYTTNFDGRRLLPLLLL